MDRQIVYPGSIPLDTDLLAIQRHALTGLGGLAGLVLGGAPAADGFACQPWAAGYGVTVGPGRLSSSVVADAAPFGSLPADPTVTVRTGLSRTETRLQLQALPDPSAVVCWLIQARLAEQDTAPVALPYWNAADPSIPFSGPGNSGMAQNTQRVMGVALMAKPSDPLPAGSYQPPPADPGWMGLFCVTTWSGRPVVAPEDIRVVGDAPFLPYRLPQLTPGFSRQVVFASNTAWEVPWGVRRVRVRLVGGGGGGGGGDSGYGGGAGGGGGYAEGIFGVQPGASYPVVVGAGGNSSPPGVTGGTGGASLFSDLLAATGGEGGGSANPNSHGGAGGSGVVGYLLQAGGYGGDGAILAGVPAGNGGTSAFGGGGRGAFLGGSQANGRAAGSGAGGGYGPGAWGGTGASGLVIAEF